MEGGGGGLSGSFFRYPEFFGCPKYFACPGYFDCPDAYVCLCSCAFLHYLPTYIHRFVMYQFVMGNTLVGSSC